MFDVEVTGRVSAGSDVTLAGVKMPAAAFDTQAQITGSNLHLVADGSAIAGTFDYSYSTSDPLEVSHGQTIGEIVSAQRLLLEPSTTAFSGTWQGKYVVKSCTFVGWTVDCYPLPTSGHTADLTLTLTESGAALTGSLRLGSHVALMTGDVRGGVLTLTGSGQKPESGGTASIQVTTWSTTRDALGRMNGAFGYVAAFTENTGRVLASTYDAGLVSVVLVPTN